MKRSPLSRRTLLKRTGWLRRSKPVARSVSEREAKLAFEAACYGKPCAVCETTAGIIDAHHVTTKQLIRKLVLWVGDQADEESRQVALMELRRRLLWDCRNAMPLCRGCHDAHHTRSAPVPRHLVPEAAWEFAAELGLTHVLERTYPEERKAA